MRWLASVVALALSCSRTPAPTESRPAAPPSHSSASANERATTGAPSAAPRRAPLGEGCHAALPSDGSIEQWLARIAGACAPGMRALRAPERVSATGGSAERRFSLRASGGCVRVVALTGDAGANLTLELVDDRGRLRARDTLPGPVALAGPAGPACFDQEGEIRVVVGGAADIVLGAYIAE